MYRLEDAVFTSEMGQTRQHCFTTRNDKFVPLMSIPFFYQQFHCEDVEPVLSCQEQQRKFDLTTQDKYSAIHAIQTHHFITSFTLCKCLSNLGLDLIAFFLLLNSIMVNSAVLREKFYRTTLASVFVIAFFTFRIFYI